jgi:hypothetical protein
MNKIISDSMPLYQCHKVVRAFQIKKISATYVDSGDGGRTRITGRTIIPVIENLAPIKVDEVWYQKFNPKAGGYFVVYEDGYTSYSPQKAFEYGYEWIC